MGLEFSLKTLFTLELVYPDTSNSELPISAWVVEYTDCTSAEG